MDFIEISTPKALYALLKSKIDNATCRLNIKDISDKERYQLLCELKALNDLFFEWMQAAEKVDQSLSPNKLR